MATAAFIPTYVSRLQKECAIEVVEAETGASVHAGCCYVAGNNLHLCPFRKLSGEVVLRRPSQPKTLFVPGVGVMMDSVLSIYGARTIGVLMTGIGDDGADQMVRIREAGGVTIAESEESCVVFGMPYQAIARGGAEIVLPSWEIAGRIWTSNPVESSTARHLQENIAPLTHIAFHFRLEASRLSPKDSASVVKAYEEMKQVVGFMTKAGDSQQSALLTILGKLSAATRLVEQTCASYALQAAESEQNVVRHLDLISNRPPQPARAQNKASALGIVLATSIGEAVKALQGHDAIRQRLEHILGALAAVRKNKPENQQDDPGHALLLQRQQAKCLLEMVVNTLRRRPWLAAGEDDRQLR